MTRPRPSRADRRFRRLLAILPFDFRREFGEEMSAVFQDEHRCTAQEGRSAVARLWFRTTFALAQLARREHLAALRSDIGYALRLVRRAPAFSLAAVTSLALGIGANAAVFGLARAALLDPLPIPDPATAVSVSVTDRQNPGLTPLSTDNFRDVRDQSTALTGVSAFRFDGARTRLNGEPENLFVVVVSGSYFETLGIRPHVGRLLGPADDVTTGGHAVAVLSHALWMRGFGGDRAALGRTIMLNDRPYAVVGVAPPEFQGTFGLARPDAFVPLAMYEAIRPGAVWADGRRWRWLNVIARLAPAVSIDDARLATRQLGDRLAVEYPEFNRDRSLTLVPLAHTVMGANQYETLSRAGWMLAGLVGALLLIACTNLANLLMARNAARAREIAVRLALGASRLRIVRQLVTESLVLSFVGGAAGLGLQSLLYSWLWAARPQALENLTVRPSIDLTVVGFTLAVSTLTALLFGLVPALRVARTDLSRTLAAGGRDVRLPARPGVRALLVTGQVALATIALVAAGLCLRSLWRADAIDPGFAHERLVAANYSVARARSPEQARQLHLDLIERARALPGVEAVAVTDRLPLTQGNAHTIDIPAAPEGTGEGVLVPFSEVSPGFFDTAGIRLLAGRDFGPDDAGAHRPPIAIVNRSMAERYWPAGQAVGGHFRARVDGSLVEIVGVVSDSKTLTLGEVAQPAMYRPLWQRAGTGQPFQWLLVSSASPESASAALRGLLREFDPDAPVNNPVILAERIDDALWAPRMLAASVGGFGVLALALASAGIYGLLAVIVGQRAHEFGLRMTLGARPGQVVRMVLRGGMTWVAAGLILGIVAGAAMTRWAQSLLYSPDRIDVAAIGGAAAVLVAAALLACLVPARRAARVDPAVAMRQ